MILKNVMKIIDLAIHQHQQKNQGAILSSPVKNLFKNISLLFPYFWSLEISIGVLPSVITTLLLDEPASSLKASMDLN